MIKMHSRMMTLVDDRDDIAGGFGIDEFARSDQAELVVKQETETFMMRGSHFDYKDAVMMISMMIMTVKSNQRRRRHRRS